MGVTGHLLSHKNGPVGQLVGEVKVKVRMVLTVVNDLVLTFGRGGAEARSLRGD